LKVGDRVRAGAAFLHVAPGPDTTMKFTVVSIFAIVLGGFYLYQSDPVDLSQLNVIAMANHATAQRLDGITDGLHR
jgi:hypothetical protein